MTINSKHRQVLNKAIGSHLGYIWNSGYIISGGVGIGGKKLKYFLDISLHYKKVYLFTDLEVHKIDNSLFYFYKVYLKSKVEKG